jgi:hypothetical protein
MLPPIEVAHDDGVQVRLGAQQPLKLVENHDQGLVVGLGSQVLQGRIPIREGNWGAHEPSNLGRQEVQMAALLALVRLEVDRTASDETLIQEVALAHSSPSAHDDELRALICRANEAGTLFLATYHAFIVAHV